MFIYATAYILYCLQYFARASSTLQISILYTTSVLCSMIAQYIRGRYISCLQCLTMTWYTITDKLILYLALIKIFSWMTKCGYLQWLWYFSICSRNIKLLTGHMTENYRNTCLLPWITFTDQIKQMVTPNSAYYA